MTAEPDRPITLRPPALMFGVPIADVTMDETVQLIAELVAEGRANRCTYQISTVNVDFLVNAMDEPDVSEILQHAAVCLPDGMPVVWASRLLEMPLRERVAGADLVPILVEQSASRGWHVHIFGSTPDVAVAAKALFRARYPGARVTIDPGPVVHDVRTVDDAVLRAIEELDADILCVALGNPKQERFIAAHARRLAVPVMIGIGGSLDMLVGKRRRAPEWMRRLGMEWIVRAVQEPRRLGTRYQRDIRVFTPALVREWAANRRRRGGVGICVLASDDPNVVDVVLDGASTMGVGDWQHAVARLRCGASLVVHAPSDTHPRDAALAQLVGLVASARRAGGHVRWSWRSGPPPSWMRDVQLAPTVLGLDAA